MRNAVVDAELDHFGVDHDELNLVRAGFIQQANNQRVHAHRFARARGARDEKMRQLGNITADGITRDVLADGEGEFRLGRLKSL